VAEEARASNLAIYTPTGERRVQRFRVRFDPAEPYGLLVFRCRNEVSYCGERLAPGDRVAIQFCHEEADTVYPPVVQVTPTSQQTFVPMVPGQVMVVYHGLGVGDCQPAGDLASLEYAGDASVREAGRRGAAFRQTGVPEEDEYLVVHGLAGFSCLVTVPSLMWKAAQYVPVLLDPLEDSRLWCGNFRYVMFHFREPTAVLSRDETIRVSDLTVRTHTAVRVVDGGWVDIDNRGGICTLARR